MNAVTTAPQDKRVLVYGMGRLTIKVANARLNETEYLRQSRIRIDAARVA